MCCRAFPITSGSTLFTFNTLATAETASGEQPAVTTGPYHSVWYWWTPTVSKTYTLATNGSAIDTTLALYTRTGTVLSRTTTTKVRGHVCL